MISLESFLKNPFDDEKISAPNFRQFGLEHNSRLAGNNPGGIYTARIAATDAAFLQFDAVYGSKTVEEAIRKGATFGLSSYTGEVLAETRLLEKLASFKFGNPSAIYLQFFPKGLTEFNNAGKGDWPQLLVRLKTATETHKAILGADVATKFATLQSTYSATQNTQVGSKGSLEDFRNLVVQKRKVLSTEMFINLLTISLNNIGNPAAIKTYFDQTIVDRRQSSDSDGKGRFLALVTDHNGTPLKGAVIDIQDEQDQNILLKQKTTDTGEYRSSPLPVGVYRITFRLAGFVTRTQTFEVFDNQDLVNEVQMTRE